MLRTIAWLTVFTVMLAAGQVLFKKIAVSVGGLTMIESFTVVLRNPVLYVALGIYGVSTVLWIWILSWVPLSQAYPWVALGTAIVPIMGWYLFGEPVAAIF